MVIQQDLSVPYVALDNGGKAPATGSGGASTENSDPESPTATSRSSMASLGERLLESSGGRVCDNNVAAPTLHAAADGRSRSRYSEEFLLTNPTQPGNGPLSGLFARRKTTTTTHSRHEPPAEAYQTMQISSSHEEPLWQPWTEDEYLRHVIPWESPEQRAYVDALLERRAHYRRLKSMGIVTLALVVVVGWVGFLIHYRFFGSEYTSISQWDSTNVAQLLVVCGLCFAPLWMSCGAKAQEKVVHTEIQQLAKKRLVLVQPPDEYRDRIPSKTETVVRFAE